MAAKPLSTSLKFDVSPDLHRAEDRRFFGVIIASLLCHVIGFVVMLYYEQHLGSEPPRLIMVDMATITPPEQPAAETPPPPKPSPTRVSASPVRTVASPPVAASPVPVAAIGDTAETRTAPSKTDMAVPVAPPVARKPADSAPAAPVTAQAVPAKAPPADGAEKLAKAQASYRATIAALIDRNKEYPVFARKAGQQGTCSVRCTMTCTGDIKRVELVKSSGYDSLDKAGIRAVQSVGKFPPPPTDGRCTEVSFEVPITFRLG